MGVKKHAIIMDGLRRKAIGRFGNGGKKIPQQMLIDDLENVCLDIIKNSEHWPQDLKTPNPRFTNPSQIAMGLESLNLNHMKVKLSQMNFKAFTPLNLSDMAA